MNNFYYPCFKFKTISDIIDFLMYWEGSYILVSTLYIHSNTILGKRENKIENKIDTTRIEYDVILI